MKIGQETMHSEMHLIELNARTRYIRRPTLRPTQMHMSTLMLLSTIKVKRSARNLAQQLLNPGIPSSQYVALVQRLPDVEFYHHHLVRQIH